jgi:hypothetical protein
MPTDGDRGRQLPEVRKRAGDGSPAAEEKVTPAAELLQPDSNPALYVPAVRTLYVDLPDTPLRASASDQWLARRFHDDGVPLRVVETAMLLGSLRRLIRPADAPRLSPIRSLAYFRPVIDELRAHPAPEGYLDYLRIKLRQAAAESWRFARPTMTEPK